MKRLVKSVFMLILVIGMLTQQTAFANMAAPSQSDVGSSITFQKNNEIAVLSEVLDITVQGAEAEIVATYRMKNTTNDSVSTQSMFLCPDIEHSGIVVLVNNKSVDYVAQRYALNYTTQVMSDGWQYVVLVDEAVASLNDEETVNTMTFQMDFAPNETYEVVVAYQYRLGGYPHNIFDAKRGEIEYYLAPAAMWKDFSNLTINLYLDEDMPIIKSSNLDFEKIETHAPINILPISSPKKNWKLS